MGNPALKIVEPDTLQGRDAARRARLAELEHEAQEAEQAAEAAHVASKNAKTLDEANAATSQIQSTTLLATNLRATAEDFRQASQTLFAEADRERKADELAKLDERLKPGEFASRKTRIADIIANARRDLRGALLELSEAVAESNGLRSRARNLAQTLGAPDFYAPVTLDDLVNSIAPVPTSYSGALPISLKCFSTNASERERRFVLEINNPLYGDAQ